MSTKTTCPDWQSLCQHREAALDDTDDALEWRVADDALKWRVADDALKWHAALRHLDGCSACQAVAPASDPTLLFRRLPALEVGDGDVEAMKQAVAGMRRGQTIEQRRGSHARPWRRAAAVAAVLLGSLMLRGAGSPSEVAMPLASAASASEIDLSQMPLIEAADPTYGSIIQVVDDDISLVLVVSSDIAVGATPASPAV